MENNESLARSFDVTLMEHQWEHIVKLLDEKERQYRAIIKKTRTYPSETVSSDVTRRKYEGMIAELEDIRNAIVERQF